MNNYNLKMEVNLENLSWLVVAERLWNQQNIKAKIQKFFLEKFDDNDATLNEQEWSEITRDVLKNLNLIGLPKKILRESEIQEVTVYIGKKIFNWTREVIKELKMDIKYAQQICWTSYGTIDETKIFERYWSKDADLPSNLNLGCPLLLYLSCKYFNERYIHFILMKMENEIEFIYKDVKFNKKECNIFNFMALSVCFHIYGQKGISAYKKLKELDNETRTGELLILCASAGLDKSIKFFWNNLNLSGQQKYLIPAAKECLAKYYPENNKWFKINDNYRKEKFAEVLTFLLRNMRKKEKYRFLVQNLIIICDVFLRSWPFQEKCLTAMGYVWESISSSKYKKLVQLILSYLFRDSRSWREINLKLKSVIISRKMFARFYETIPKHIKKKIITPNIFDFFNNWDFASLELIIHDEDLQDYNEKIIYFYHDYINTIRLRLVPEDGFEHLQIFSQILTKSERNKLRQKFCYYLEYYVKKDDNLNLANRFLNWLSGSEEGRNVFRRQINTEKISRELLTEEKYDLIENILKWQLVSLDEFKKEFGLKSDDYIRWNFFKIWAEIADLSDLEQIKNRCVKLLRWCLNSNDISVFLEKKLIGDDDTFFLILLYFDANSDNSLFKIKLNELFRFCNVSLDQQERIKERLKKYVDEWIEIGNMYKYLGEVPVLWDPREERYIYFRFCNFNTLDAIINWIFADEGDRKSVIAKFINSSKGAEFCVKEFTDCRIRKSLDPILDVFNKWLLPYGDISKIKNHVKNIDPDAGVLWTFKRDVSGMLKLLDILQKERFLAPNDIVQNID